MCSELTPRACIPDTRIPQFMQPCTSSFLPFTFTFMIFRADLFLPHSLLRLKFSLTILWTASYLKLNDAGSLRKKGGKMMSRKKKIRRAKVGESGTPRVFSPSCPSGCPGAPQVLQSCHRWTILFRKGVDEKRTLPINDIGCVSYLTVGWITSTMWKAFRVSSATIDDSQHFSTGRSCSNWLVRHWGAGRRSKKRQEIWEDLGRGETEMWKHSPKALPQQVKFHI